MKLATLDNGTRDGELVVVSRDLARAWRCPRSRARCRHALDDWTRAAPALPAIADELDAGRMPGRASVRRGDARAPLPRAYQWADGSAYVNHVELVRQARAARRCRRSSGPIR